ncbi:MAG: pyruvate dehydrogenase complex dihydrolipoamide acetyltransferase [Rhodospirillaceae bacterium]|nr:pyruvate dehydrogenase complex dihydrolipoamide acetyltransferase [Rhodospirillaceae bacterium]
MPTQILMPALSPTMTEGKLAKWIKKEGDSVKSGDVIAEIETDKATMEMEAVDEGKIGKILIPEGTEKVQVNEPIAVLLADGESAKDIVAAPAKAAPAPTAKAPPAAEGGNQNVPKPAAAPAPVPAPQAAAPKPAAAPAAKPGDRVFASPLAKRLAANANFDLKGVQGSGPNGRIVKADVEQAIAAGPRTAPKAAAAQGSAPGTFGSYKAVPNSSMRKIIAKRLQESKQTVPHFYLTVDYIIDDLLKLRKDVNEKGGYKISVNDFVIKACAIALRKMPHVNASWAEEEVHVYDDVDISVAVATPEGLITPIVRKADQKSLSAISAEMKDLASRAKDKKLKLEEFQGGGFSISNLGMFGVKDFAAIINPPQACILAVGAGEQRPVVKNGALAIANVMSCTLSVDHRVVDGAVGAEFLQVLKGLIENPLTMLV